MSYRGEKLDVPAALAAFPELARTDGFAIETFGEVAGFPLYALTREADRNEARHVYVSAGVHGDEPAGPAAILQALRERTLPRSVTWTICPLLNPTGLVAGTRTNARGIDLNRDYTRLAAPEVAAHAAWLAGRTFDVALCLHEDYDTSGFYLYELGPETGSLAPRILAAIRPILPIETATELDEFPAEGGVIRPTDADRKLEADDLPEALYLERHAPRGCTLETPSNAFPLETRARAHIAGLLAAAG